MAVDTPAKIAVLGAGPMGLESALYARFLGYDVEVFDRGDVAENVGRWGHVRMFSPFGMNASPLGLAAIQAQDEQYQVPAADAMLSGSEWREKYLLPLSRTDLLEDHLRLRVTVVAVSRRDLWKRECLGDPGRTESQFRLLCREPEGRESESYADIVIDSTGVFGNPNWIGPGGAPAIHERDARDRMEGGIPDILGTDRSRFENKHVLIIGSGHSAATSIVALQSLSEFATATRVTWLTRRPQADDGSGPVPSVHADPLPERYRLVTAANLAAASAGGIVSHWPATTVSRIHWDEARGQFEVEFSGEHAGRGAFDRVIANVGYRPDSSLSDELQVQLCYATGGPMKLASSLLAAPSDDCSQQVSPGPASLLTTEPNYYILGAKSYGRSPNFLMALGLTQIRDLFTIIGDREKLDLYQRAQRLPR